MNAESKMKKAVKKLAESNYKRSVKLRAAKLKTEGYSIYLDIWHQGQREYRFLKLYITGDPVRDDEAIRLALSIRDKEEKSLYRDGEVYSLTAWKKRSDFIEYFLTLAKKKNDPRFVQAQKWFVKFAGNKLLFNQITHRLISDYQDWLFNDSGLGHNSAWLYMAKLKAALNQAVNEEILELNPARAVKTIQRRDTDRHYLELSELELIANTPCKSDVVKRAFLFSCYTGLRHSDLIALTWGDITDDYITIVQQKTKKIVKNKMLTEAKKQLGERGRDKDKVFDLPCKTWTVRIIREWIKNAGIDKVITFHSGRHTFAMLFLEVSDGNIYTLKGLLGHSNIETTQIYGKMIDRIKDAGIDKLSDALDKKRNGKPNEEE